MKFTTILTALALTAAASGLLGQGIPRPMTEVHGRIVVEPSYPSTFPGEIRLTLTNAAGTTVEDVTVSESVKTTNFGGMTGEAHLAKDGKFLILLPNSPTQFRLIVRLRPSPNATTAERYFVKSVQSSGVNLLESPLVVTRPVAGEIVITVAKCMDETPAECK